MASVLKIFRSPYATFFLGILFTLSILLLVQFNRNNENFVQTLDPNYIPDWVHNYKCKDQNISLIAPKLLFYPYVFQFSSIIFLCFRLKGPRCKDQTITLIVLPHVIIIFLTLLLFLMSYFFKNGQIGTK